MDIMSGTILTPELVNLELDVENKIDAIVSLSHLLLDQGLIKESFLSAICQREEEFPTGLFTGKYGVAIPHTDIEHVNQQAIAIGRLTHPVKFIMMGTSDMEIEVVFVVVLAITHAEDQVKFLQSLMAIFQDELIMDKLVSIEDENEMVRVFNKYINEV